MQSGSIENDYRFTGKAWDAEAGLFYFNARWMDPDTGRFISEDPLWGNIGDPQSLNRFAYGRNNPFKYKDPTGLEDTEVQDTDSDNDENDEIADKIASNDYLANKAIEEKYERLRDRVDLNFDHYGLSAKDIREIQTLNLALSKEKKNLDWKDAVVICALTGLVASGAGGILVGLEIAVEETLLGGGAIMVVSAFKMAAGTYFTLYYSRDVGLIP